MYRSARPVFTLARQIPGAANPAKLSPTTLARLYRTQSTRPNPRASSIAQIWRTQYSTKPPVPPTGPDLEAEKELGKKKLEAHPESVSTQSSVRHVRESSQAPEQDHDMAADLKDDLQTVRSTFALNEVPRESYALGLAGTIPYLATSVSTLYLSWNLNTEWPTSSNFLNSFLMSHESAHQYLALLEPVQLGYGAVIISFLGAIHWGLEYAEKKPSKPRTTFRYGMGVLAPVLAWPTVVLPIQFGLTAQFLAFVGLYFADARATARGWAPHWYGSYRFVLTAVVGLSIFLSLVGRAEIGDTRARLTTEDLKDFTDKHTSGAQKYTKEWEEKEKVAREEMHKEKEEEEKKKKQEEKKQAKEEEKKKAMEKKGDKKDGSEKSEEKKETKAEDKAGDKEEGPNTDDKDGKAEDKKAEKADNKSDDKVEKDGDKNAGDKADGGKDEKAPPKKADKAEKKDDKEKGGEEKNGEDTSEDKKDEKKN